jgi:hypothetical protein
VFCDPSCRVAGGRKRNGLRARFSAHPQPAPQCVGEAHWSVGRRRLGRPARPPSQYPRVLLGGAVVSRRRRQGSARFNDALTRPCTVGMPRADLPQEAGLCLRWAPGVRCDIRRHRLPPHGPPGRGGGRHCDGSGARALTSAENAGCPLAGHGGKLPAQATPGAISTRPHNNTHAHHRRAEAAFQMQASRSRRGVCTPYAYHTQQGACSLHARKRAHPNRRARNWSGRVPTPTIRTSTG